MSTPRESAPSEELAALHAQVRHYESELTERDAVIAQRDAMIGVLRATVDRSRLGPPKPASEGAEQDRTWPATVPTRDGTVLEVTDERLIWWHTMKPPAARTISRGVSEPRIRQRRPSRTTRP